MSDGKNTKLKPVTMSKLKKSQVTTCLMSLFFAASRLRNLPIQWAVCMVKKNNVILYLCFFSSRNCRKKNSLNTLVR